MGLVHVGGNGWMVSDHSTFELFISKVKQNSQTSYELIRATYMILYIVDGAEIANNFATSVLDYDEIISAYKTAGISPSTTTRLTSLSKLVPGDYSKECIESGNTNLKSYRDEYVRWFRVSLPALEVANAGSGLSQDKIETSTLEANGILAANLVEATKKMNDVASCRAYILKCLDGIEPFFRYMIKEGFANQAKHGLNAYIATAEAKLASMVSAVQIEAEKDKNTETWQMWEEKAQTLSKFLKTRYKLLSPEDAHYEGEFNSQLYRAKLMIYGQEFLTKNVKPLIFILRDNFDDYFTLAELQNIAVEFVAGSTKFMTDIETRPEMQTLKVWLQ